MGKEKTRGKITGMPGTGVKMWEAKDEKMVQRKKVIVRPAR